MSPRKRCRIPGCTGYTGQRGSARGLCVRHYARWHKHGTCQAEPPCERPAISHIGLCEEHTPQWLLR